MKRVEIGVFLPVAKSGFIRSANSPAYHPSYRDNLDIAVLAEEIGLDYAFSMLKWRGFGGPTNFWGSSLESLSLTAALGAVTKRIRLIATINPLLHHPASAAKTVATIQDISQGRMGLNIITGLSLDEYNQMGIVPPGYDKHRYEYAGEWLHVLKRLWSEPSVTHHGTYFHLDDCISEPKPQPLPFIVCAAASDEGFRFTAQNADYIFINAMEPDILKANSHRAHDVAAEQNRSIKTSALVLPVLGDTKADAEAYWAHLLEGADLEAGLNFGKTLSASTREKTQARGAEFVAERRKVDQSISFQAPMIGSSDEVAERIVDLCVTGGIDNITLIFVDYIEGLRRFGAEVMPLLRKKMQIGPCPS